MQFSSESRAVAIGQYHKIVSLTRKEYLDPRGLGDGIKLMEFGMSGHGGALTGLALLLACSNGRGGGDLAPYWGGPGALEPLAQAARAAGTPLPEGAPLEELAERAMREIVGRWAGDRVAIVGDYATVGDLPTEDRADLIYNLCGTREGLEETQRWCADNLNDPRYEQYREHYEELLALTPGDLYHDITPSLRYLLLLTEGIVYDDDDGFMRRRDLRDLVPAY